MLGMYTRGGEGSPVEVFEGHTDVVKEFVWRKGGPGALAARRTRPLGSVLISTIDEFQLITWSKDRTLRFWPVDNDTLQVHRPTLPPFPYLRSYSFKRKSDIPPNQRAAAPASQKHAYH